LEPFFGPDMMQLPLLETQKEPTQQQLGSKIKRVFSER